MPPFLVDSSKSIVLAVDVQPKFLAAIHDGPRILERCRFLVEAAAWLGVPVVATVQNPDRMGGVDEGIARHLAEPPDSKMTFSCSGCDLFDRRFSHRTPIQAILVGIESHICITQTALELLALGHSVVLCADAIGARSEDRHLTGLDRLRSAGAVVAHSESVVYEWMRTAEHSEFRSVLDIVKRYA